MWRRSAKATASARLLTPNLLKMLLTWNLTVEGLTINCSAIRVLLCPSTINVRTLSSLSVSRFNPCSFLNATVTNVAVINNHAIYSWMGGQVVGDSFN
jgi:hypothetical protein